MKEIRFIPCVSLYLGKEGNVLLNDSLNTGFEQIIHKTSLHSVVKPSSRFADENKTVLHDFKIP